MLILVLAALFCQDLKAQLLVKSDNSKDLLTRAYMEGATKMAGIDTLTPLIQRLN